MKIEQIEVYTTALLDMHLRKPGAKEGLAMRQGDIFKRISQEMMIELIIETLPEDDCIRLVDIYEKLGLEKGKKKRSILNAIDKMEKDGDRRIKIKRIRRKGSNTATILYRPEAEDSVRSNYPKYFETKKKIPRELRLQHTNEIKDVITHWIHELKDIPSINDIRVPLGRSQKLSRFEVENDLLLYVEPHLTFKEDLYEHWYEFKEDLSRYENGKMELYSSICKKLSDDLDLELADRWRDHELIHPSFPFYIYDALVKLARGDEYDFKSFLTFESSVSTNERLSLKTYRVDPDGFVRIDTEESEVELKGRMDDYLRSTIEGLKGSNSEGEMFELGKLEDAMNKLKVEIWTILERNLKVPLFGGECDICRKLISNL